MDESKKPKLCRHGKKFCCECEYGVCQERDFVEDPIDAVEEMNRARGRFNSGNPLLDGFLMDESKDMRQSGEGD